MRKNCENNDCSIEFESTNERQKYCSDSCKTMAYNKRKGKSNDEPDTVKNKDEFALNFTDEEQTSIRRIAADSGFETAEYLRLKILIDDNRIKEYEHKIQELTDKEKQLRIKLSYFSGKSITDVQPNVVIVLTEKQREIIEDLLKNFYPEGEGQEFDLGKKILLELLHRHHFENIYYIKKEDIEKYNGLCNTLIRINSGIFYTDFSEVEIYRNFPEEMDHVNDCIL